MKKRTPRLNSLLKEVISDVIRRDVKNPHVNELLTVTRVEITNDLHYAKVYISVIGSDEQKNETLKALQSAAGFIAVNSSKKVIMRYFPTLNFKLDDSLEKHLRIQMLLREVSEERKSRTEEGAADVEAETSDEDSVEDDEEEDDDEMDLVEESPDDDAPKST